MAAAPLEDSTTATTAPGATAAASASTDLDEAGRGGDQDFWKTNAWRILRSYVKLLWQEGVSETALAERILETNVGKAAGERGKRHIGITFFAPLSGEPVTAPHIRTCAINDELVRKVQRAALKSRSGLDPAAFDNVAHINPEDVFFVSDGGAAGPAPRASSLGTSE